MIPIKLITKEEAEKNGWANQKPRRSSGMFMAAGEDKNGIITVEHIDMDTKEIINKVKYHKDTKEQIFNFNKERDGKYENFKQ